MRQWPNVAQMPLNENERLGNKRGRRASSEESVSSARQGQGRNRRNKERRRRSRKVE